MCLELFSRSEREEFEGEARRGAGEAGDGAGKVEAGAAGVAGVQVADGGVGLVGRFVGVAEDDEVGFFAGEEVAEVGGGAGGFDDVVEEEFAAGEVEDFGFAEGQAGVVVAEDGSDGGDFFEGGDEGGLADVAGVEDVVHAAEKLGDAGIEVAVGVGDEADVHPENG